MVSRGMTGCMYHHKTPWYCDATPPQQSQTDLHNSAPPFLLFHSTLMISYTLWFTVAIFHYLRSSESKYPNCTLLFTVSRRKSTLWSTVSIFHYLRSSESKYPNRTLLFIVSRRKVVLFGPQYPYSIIYEIPNQNIRIILFCSQ